MIRKTLAAEAKRISGEVSDIVAISKGRPGIAHLGELIFLSLCIRSGLSLEQTEECYRLGRHLLFSDNEVSLLSSESGLGFLTRDAGGQEEENKGVISFRCITNDGSPDSMAKLINLKNIFSRQLPKMPREYIARLVLDRHH